MTPVRLEFDLDEAAAAAGLAVFTASPTRAARRWVGLAAAAAFAGLYLAGAPAAVSAALGVAGGLALAFGGRQSPDAARRMLTDPTGSAALGRRVVEVSPPKLVVQTKYSREEYNWSAVLRVKRAADLVVLVLPGPRPVVIPRSAFPDAAAFAAFADDLQAAVGETV